MCRPRVLDVSRTDEPCCVKTNKNGVLSRTLLWMSVVMWHHFEPGEVDNQRVMDSENLG